jgi:chromate transport protein ChrA
VIALTLRVHGLGGRPWLVLGVIAALSIISTLPWLTAILLTDIFCGLGVLALYLLLMRAEALSGRERIGLILLVALAAATHSATMAVLLALMLAALFVFQLDRGRIALPAFGTGCSRSSSAR